MNKPEKIYTIKEVEEMFDLPASTLRYYEEEGILTNVKKQSGKRIYAQSHINRLGAVCCFKRAGMTIAQLRSFFQYEQEERIDDILLLLKNQQTKIELEMKRMEEDYVHIQKKLHYYTDIKEASLKGNPKPKWENYK